MSCARRPSKQFLLLFAVDPFAGASWDPPSECLSKHNLSLFAVDPLPGTSLDLSRECFRDRFLQLFVVDPLSAASRTVLKNNFCLYLRWIRSLAELRVCI